MVDGPCVRKVNLSVMKLVGVVALEAVRMSSDTLFFVGVYGVCVNSAVGCRVQGLGA